MENYAKHHVKGKVEKYIKKAFKIIFFMLAAVIFILLFAYVFMRLWNWLMPDIFDLGAITYWQAFGLLVLAKLVFGGFGGGHKNGRKKGKGERFKKSWKGRCGDDYSKWKLYDQFWKEEGEKAFESYVQQIQQQNGGADGEVQEK